MIAAEDRIRKVENVDELINQPDLKRKQGAQPQQRSESPYPNVSRTISTYSISSHKHPLNVKPSGNSFLMLDNQDLIQARSNSLGSLNLFPDDLIMELISFIDDIETLKNLSQVSKIMYAFLYDEDFWKQVYIKHKFENIEWRGSWKNTVLKSNPKNQAKIKLADNLLCSDLLYRPYQISQINYELIFKNIINEEEIYHNDALQNNLRPLPSGRIARIPESDLDLQQFNDEYHDQPFILTNNNKDRWPQWSLASLLDRFPSVKFRQEAVEWNLADYSTYTKSNHDENPLYLFDCNSIAMKTLRQEYQVPQVFDQDLFKYFNVNDLKHNCRPDHAWLIVGPKRSGSTFHKDPNYTSAWNAALTGRKLWIMLPPNMAPPGVGADEEESEVTSPVGIGEWVIAGFFNDCLKIPECLIAVTFPGECMYVPSGWWHSVINIDDSVALTQNFVPMSKLPNALNFLKNKREQLSGFHPSSVKHTLDYVLDTLLAGEEGQDKNEDIIKLREYRDQFNSLNLSDELIDEDCGEMSDLPPMPIFELFKQLMIINNKSEQLNEGLERLIKIELKNYERLTGKSQTWEKLIETKGEDNQTASAGGFSFGFNFNEDESSDEE
ncbi:hypothetical protein DFJ63DRAFT_257937 [Scheffersomyces coipomensis]|uniref:uncharacterized protein n=1 Tax=Scheffersomyces coipomensis TaxID=1788519 RepID=UPI00315DAECE